MTPVLAAFLSFHVVRVCPVCEIASVYFASWCVPLELHSWARFGIRFRDARSEAAAAAYVRATAGGALPAGVLLDYWVRLLLVPVPWTSEAPRVFFGL